MRDMLGPFECLPKGGLHHIVMPLLEYCAVFRLANGLILKVRGNSVDLHEKLPRCRIGVIVSSFFRYGMEKWTILQRSCWSLMGLLSHGVQSYSKG